MSELKKAIATGPNEETLYVKLSSIEKSDRDKDETRWEAGKKLREWKSELASYDKDLPRWAEDIIAALPKATQDKIDNTTISIYNTKQKLRAKRPI